MHDGRDKVAAGVLTLLALPGVLALGGCANSPVRRGQRDLAELQRDLPGTYTSSSGNGATGATTQASSGVTLFIQPITAQLIGDPVYFVRETPADNPRLVLAQGIWTLVLEGAAPGPGNGRARGSEDRAKRIVEHRFLFKDPRRWIGAADNPDLLLSMVPQDLQALSGCDLVWQRTPTGFETDTLQSCHPGSNAQGLWIDQHAQLAGGQLTLTQRRTDADGSLDSAEPLSLQLTRAGGAH